MNLTKYIIYKSIELLYWIAIQNFKLLDFIVLNFILIKKAIYNTILFFIIVKLKLFANF